MTDERGVQSIDRALDIIEVLAVEESGLGGDGDSKPRGTPQEYGLQDNRDAV